MSAKGLLCKLGKTMGKNGDRDVRLSLVLNFIKERGVASRAEISQSMGISLTTTGKYLNELLKCGAIAEVGVAESTGGRRTRLLGINPDLGPGIGVEIGVTRLRCVVSDVGGRIQFEVERDLENSTDIICEVESIIREALERYPNVRAIGVASSGIIEYMTGTSLFSPHREDLRNLPLRGHFEKLLERPVVLDDVCRAYAVAEKYLGSAKDWKDFIYLYLDEGIGAGVVINGRVYRGMRGIAGEIGHVVVDENGPRCGCGNFGCLETFASCKALVREAKMAINAGVASTLGAQEISIEAIIASAQEGDKFCYKLITEAGEKIGLVLSQVLNILGISNIVIGGRLKSAEKLITEPIIRIVKTHSLTPVSQELSVRISSMGENAGAIGIAVEALLSTLSCAVS